MPGGKKSEKGGEGEREIVFPGDSQTPYNSLLMFFIQNILLVVLSRHSTITSCLI